MKIVFRILVGLVVAVVMVIVVALVVIETKYQAILPSPVIAAETVADPNASIRVSVRPPAAIELIRPLLAAEGLPAWVADRVLPYEGAIFFTPQFGARTFGFRVCLNEQRFGPIIATAPEKVGLSKLYPFVTWAGNVMSSSRRGELSLDGSMELPALGAEAIQKYWGEVYQLKRPVLEGGHFLEAVVDNRDGSLFGLLATLDSHNAPRLGLPLPDMAKTLLPISTLRVTGDLASPDLLNLKFVVDCRPESEETAVSTTDFQLGMLLGAAAKELKDKDGIDLKGVRRREGTQIVGEYTLSGIQRLVQQEFRTF